MMHESTTADLGFAALAHRCPFCRVWRLLEGPHGEATVFVKCNNPDCSRGLWLAPWQGLLLFGAGGDHEEKALCALVSAALHARPDEVPPEESAPCLAGGNYP